MQKKDNLKKLKSMYYDNEFELKNDIESIFFHQKIIYPEYFTDISSETFRNILKNLTKLIHYEKNKYFFLSNKLILKKLMNLNIRLSINQLSLLSESKLLAVLNLMLKKKLTKVPQEIIQIGLKHNLIKMTYLRNYFFFPIAQLLNSLSNPTKKIFLNTLTIIDEKDLYKVYSLENIMDDINSGMRSFKPKVRKVIYYRENLKNHRYTLRQIATKYNISAEAVRKRENIFWNKINTNYENCTVPFVQAFLKIFFNNSCSNIFKLNIKMGNILLFLCRCFQVKFIHLKELDIIFIFNNPKELKSILKKENNIYIDTFIIFNTLKLKLNSNISLSSVKFLSEIIKEYREANISSTQRIYITLKKIGKPSHYFEITKQHNKNFPNHFSKPNTIHSYLCRRKHGIVWTGVRGTFGLEEWGFSNPNKSLKDDAFETINKIFTLTKSPVKFSEICNDLNSRGRGFREQSLRMAISMNPQIKVISSNLYIPNCKLKAKEQ